jgi:hypothetical protein
MYLLFMKKNYLKCLLVLLLLPVTGMAQNQGSPLTISVFTNATSLPPGVLANLFVYPLHPGVTIGTAFKYNDSERHEIFQTVKLGYLYHRYSQHAAQLYTEGAYRFNFKNGIGIGPLLGLGYLHSFPDTQIFELQENGEYEKKISFGKPQVMATVAVEAGYTFSISEARPVRVFMNYQFWLQFPFVRQYVPLLPNTALHVGVSVPLEK